MSSIYDVDDKKAAVGMAAMRAPGGAPGRTSGAATLVANTPVNDAVKNAVYQPAGTRGSNFTGSPVYGSNDTGKGYITAIDGTKQPAAGETGSTSGGAATSASGSHRVPVPEHLQGGKVGTTWGYEDVERDREEQGAFEQTSTGGGTAYQNTGAGSGSGGNPLAWWSSLGQNAGSSFPWMTPGNNSQAGGEAGSGSVLNATNQGYVDAMKEAYDAQAQARAAALEQMLRMYDGQNALIGQQYDQAARDAYANARISAIGNNEALAAQGLAGGLYQNPISGMSETSRVAQDNALRSNLLSVQIARQQATQQVAQDINALRAQGMYDAADLAASQAEALINLQMQLNEQQYQREIDAFNMQNA